MYRVMASRKSLVLRCVPRLICLRVSSTHQRSTRLSHGALVGGSADEIGDVAAASGGWRASCASRGYRGSNGHRDRRHRRLDAVQKLTTLLGAMARVAGPDDDPSFHIQRAEQRRRPMPDVVVGLSGRQPRTHGQQGRRAIERLDLVLLIHAEHQRAILIRPGSRAGHDYSRCGGGGSCQHHIIVGITRHRSRERHRRRWPRCRNSRLAPRLRDIAPSRPAPRR